MNDMPNIEYPRTAETLGAARSELAIGYVTWSSIKVGD